MTLAYWCGDTGDEARDELVGWLAAREHTPECPSSPNTARNDADRDTLTQIRDDNVGALHTLVERYAPSMESYAYSLVRTQDVARDVVQDVFIQVWERRKVLDVHHSVASYLHRMVRYRALNVLKHERVHQRAEDAVRGTYAVTPAVVQNAGEAAIEAAEFWQRVDQALGALQPRCREIFLLHREQGLSYAEIADLLGVSLPTIYNQMAKATKRLAEFLAM